MQSDAELKGWQDAINSVRASLQQYPNAGGDITIMAEVERILAAKDAELAELKRQLKSLEKTMRLEDETTAAERKGWTARAEDAERERDSYLQHIAISTEATKRERVELNEAWQSQYDAMKRERDSLREALVGVMPQVQPCASAYCEEHGHTDCPFGIANAALKAGKDGQQ